MNFYIASGFQNKYLVQFVASKLKEAGWQHTYDWTKNEKATHAVQLQEIGQAERQAIKDADVFLLLLDGGKGSHTEFGMALAWEKKIYMYHENNPLQTTFYHLPEVNMFQGEIEQFISYVVEKERV
ncbi:nucleoside 2-deoxyribosyltransferase [Bacillus sp. DX4.1]|uniref:nucleoside 2-deoxyribosyltransferase n=1 Tax=Bacillus sp. DX4.1 TaxID=3055867 RepID=UPI0025A16C2B|nr:nucleoside 2-deoxyribosyltransferase [Bacillus sp. DX4.1]MDM5189963.1 nucleoside 2-deoxyribosyltransferase [Bacillus sp. DX4.1]